jgi:hypothetical protein
MRPPKIRRCFHGTAAVRSYADALAWLGRMVGCVALEFSDAPPPVARIGGCCFLGDSMIELAEPNAPETPTAKFLERFGPGYLNLAVHLDDLFVAHEWLTAHGAAPSIPPDRGFTFTRPNDTSGLQFEWANLNCPQWDPHDGAPMPPRPPALIDVPRLGEWGALVRDTREAVARFKELCDTPLLFERHDAPPDQPAAAFSLVDCVMTLYRLPDDAAEEMRLWGTRVGRPRFHLMGFRIRDLAAAGRVFEHEGVRILRGGAASGRIVTDPADTHGLCMAWSDRDVPGDPRGPLA